MIRSLYRAMARIGLKGLLKAEATAQGGKLNASWDVVFGDKALQKAGGSVFSALSTKEKEGVLGKHAIVFACVRLLCDSFMEGVPEVGVVDDTGENWTRIPKHPVAYQLQWPNPELTQGEYTAYDLAHLHLTGKSFIWKWRDATGKVSELWPIPSSWVRIVPLSRVVDGDPRRFISHYEVTPIAGQRPTIVAVGDMIFRRFVDPGSFLGSSSPMDAAYRPYKLDVAKDDYLMEMLENLNVPGIVLRQQEQFDAPQKEELRKILSETIGKGKRGSPLFLYGENAGIDVIAPLKDLDWPGLSGLSESHICAAFGCPPLLVHARIAQENTPLSTPSLDAATLVFARTTMIPLWRGAGESMTRGLLWSEGLDQRFSIRYNISGVKALQDDMVKTADWTTKAVNGSVMQINEARSKLGLDPDPDRENVYLIPMGMQELRVEDVAPEPQEEEPHDAEWEDV